MLSPCHVMGVTDAVGGLLQTILLKIFVDLQT